MSISLEDLQTVDATQPDDDAVVDLLIINHPGEAAMRWSNLVGGAMVGGTISYPFKDFRVSLPELGDDLVGGLTIELPYESTLADLWRVAEDDEIRVRWFQSTLKVLDAGGQTVQRAEARVDDVVVDRGTITLQCVGRRPLDEPAGDYYDLERFPSLESFETQGEFRLPPISEA